MKLRHLILTATTAMQLGFGGVAAFSSPEVSGDLNEAAATIMGTTVRDFYKTIEENRVKLDREKFIAGVVSVFYGDSIGGYDYISAETAIRTLINPAAKPYATADEAAEIAWVESKITLPGAERLTDGIILQRISEGTGENPAPGSVVKVLYAGRLSDGTVFDETEAPFDLPMGRVIPGLAKAMEQMRYGGIYRVYIPPKMGYGSEAVMDLIPANSALDFTIELIK